MTALAGYWDLGRGTAPAAACSRILKGQAIYGLQDALWNGVPLSLGRRLYPRLPEDRFDRGPVEGAGGKLVLAADARVDNREELADALGIGRTDLARLSDTELLMRGFEAWDDDLLTRVIGDFALALWQPERRRLLLARDFIGRAPLHYHVGGGFFAFASMPKGLHALPEIPREADRVRAADFLALTHSLGDASFYRGVKRVEAGHVVTVTPDGVQIRKYWDPDLSPLRLESRDEYAEALRDALDRAVASRLRGTGDAVAAQLSAGLDSSAVAATAARRLAPEGRRVVAFTSVPAESYVASAEPGRIPDEGPLAAETARLHPNMDHVLVRTGERSLVETLERNVILYDRPRLNLCNQLWLDAIKDEAKQRGLSVMLTGDTGNLGMSYSGLHLLPQLLVEGRLVRLTGELVALRRAGFRTRGLLNATLAPFLPKRLYDTLIAARSPAVRTLGRADRTGRRTRPAPRVDGVAERLHAYRAWDSAMHNKGTLAGWGIDLREPTGDRRLVELCLRIPLDQFLAGGRTRLLARNAFADRLPPAVIEETRRGYQAADWRLAFARDRNVLAQEVARIVALPDAGELLDVERMKRLLDKGAEGTSARHGTTDYRYGLLRAVSVGHFLRRVAGSNQ